MPLPFVSLLQDLEAACAHLYVRLALHDVDTYNTHRNWAFHPVSLLECLSLLHPCCRTWKQLALTCTSGSPSMMWTHTTPSATGPFILCPSLNASPFCILVAGLGSSLRSLVRCTSGSPSMMWTHTTPSATGPYIPVSLPNCLSPLRPYCRTWRQLTPLCTSG